MTAGALINVCTFAHGYDFTTDTNAARIPMTAAVKDATTFKPAGSGGWQDNVAALKSATLELKGFWQAGAGQVDAEAFSELGVANRAVTLAPTGLAGDVAYLMQAGKFGYQLLGQIGELAPFTLACRCTNGVGVVRGKLAKAKGDVSAVGVLGSAVELGAVAAGQYLYATLHLFAAGTTITVALESDDNAGFTTPTTRATLGPLTAAGGTWMPRVAGPITDTFYRFNVTAITGAFTVAGAIGIA